MTTTLRIGTDDFLLVPWSDVLRIRDRGHAERLLENQRDLSVRGCPRLLDQLAAGDLMLVRLEPPRPILHVAACDPIEPDAVPSPAPDPSPPAWLAIEVRHGSGTGYPRAPFVLELPDGSERFEYLDDDSRWYADDIPSKGTCRLRFDPPLCLSSVAQRGEPRGPVEAAAAAIALQDRGLIPARLATAAAHLLVVPKTDVHAARVGDVYFGTARAVVLPASPEGRPRGQRTPLEAIAAVLAHVATAKQRPLALIAGHTDTTGSDPTNDTLSQARATNVELLLRGDAAGWAAHAQAHHAVADLQRILQWAAARHGWACDPGPSDGELGPKTRAARRAFHEAYNQEMSGTLPLDVDTSERDWEAVFELYTQELAVLLHDLGGPSALWPVVRSRSLGTVACGERWPAQGVVVDDHEHDEDRRVEILLFELDDLPDLTHPEPGYDVYGSGRYRIVPVPPRPRIRLLRLKIQDWRGKGLPDTPYELVEAEGAHVGKTDAQGFTERFLVVEGKPAGLWVDGQYYFFCEGELEDDVGLTFPRSRLNALGHQAGRVSGENERQSRAAIRNFQWLRGLPITGELDAATLDTVCNATGS